MTLKELFARQKEIIDGARNEKRDLNEEEQREFDELQRSIETALEAREHMNTSGPAGEQNSTPEGDNARSAGIAAERERIKAVTELCRSFNLSPDNYIERGDSLENVRAAVIEELKKTSAPASVRVTADAEDKRRAAIADGILVRNGIHVEKPAPGYEDFRGTSISNIAASCLANEDTEHKRNYYTMSPDELFSEIMSRSYFNPTSAFPAIMDNIVNKAYVEGHKTAPVTFDRFCTKGTLKDFKAADNYYVRGSFGEFLEVPEGGELKATLPQDEKLPQRKLKTYGRQFTMSRQAFINDDMGVVTTMPNMAAKAARTTINTQVYKILVGNPKVYDGEVLFGAKHKNLLKTGTGITKEAVQSMILALGSHTKKADGAEQAIIIRPAVIVVPLGYKFEMYTLFNSEKLSASGDINPLYQYRDVIEVVEDPTLNVLAGTNAIPWYMVGNSNDTDFIQIDYLNGQEIPNIRRMEKAGQLGFVWDVYADWGITVLDPIGAVMNPGIKITSPLAVA
jgi:hypothetical protein